MAAFGWWAVLLPSAFIVAAVDAQLSVHDRLLDRVGHLSWRARYAVDGVAHTIRAARAARAAGRADDRAIDDRLARAVVEPPPAAGPVRPYGIRVTPSDTAAAAWPPPPIGRPPLALTMPPATAHRPQHAADTISVTGEFRTLIRHGFPEWVDPT